MPYCGQCESTQPVLTLVWCEFCREFHDYGTVTKFLGVESQTVRVCLACGSMLHEHVPDEEVPLSDSEDSE